MLIRDKCSEKKERYYPLFWATQNYFHYSNEFSILGLSCRLVCYFTTIKTIETYLFFVINAIKIILYVLCEQTKTKRWHTVLWFPRSASKNLLPPSYKSNATLCILCTTHEYSKWEHEGKGMYSIYLFFSIFHAGCCRGWRDVPTYYRTKKLMFLSNEVRNEDNFIDCHERPTASELCKASRCSTNTTTAFITTEMKCVQGCQ